QTFIHFYSRLCVSVPLWLTSQSKWPTPFHDFRLVDTVFMRITATANLQVAELLLCVRANCLKPRHAIDHIYCQREPINLVFNRQLQRRVDVAALFVPAYVQVLMVVPVVAQPVNQPGIAMKIEYNRLVHCEQTVKVTVAEAMRMLAIRLQLEEIQDVD